MKRSKYFFDEEHLVEIWGAQNCPYCDRAKKLCAKEGLSYRYYQLDEDYTKEELIELFIELVPEGDLTPLLYESNKKVKYKEKRVV